MSVSLQAQSLVLQNAVTKAKLEYLYPKNTVTQMDRINCVKLRADLRPSGWPDRIPFGVGIDSSQQAIYFNNYRGFMKKSIRSYRSPDFRQLEDICVDESGRIFAVDSVQNKIFQFQLNSDLVTLTRLPSISIQKPFRCETSPGGWLAVLTRENQLAIYKNRIVQGVFAVESPRDITITPHALVLLSADRLTKYNLLGFAEKSVALDRSFTAVENSHEGDVFLLDGKERSVRKLNPNLEKIEENKLGEGQWSDMTVYETFGFLAVTSGLSGAYYAMRLEVPELGVKNNPPLHLISFTTTFPADVTINVKTGRGIAKSFYFQNLPADHHELNWDGVAAPYTIELLGKARYSLANRVVKTYTVGQ